MFKNSCIMTLACLYNFIADSDNEYSYNKNLCVNKEHNFGHL